MDRVHFCGRQRRSEREKESERGANERLRGGHATSAESANGNGRAGNAAARGAVALLVVVAVVMVLLLLLIVVVVVAAAAVVSQR
ncbi:hypothetical protein TYRP_008386 [Tyrophagus putrescentiae]|nr:hypothetical protein TYRP_008386 [Tyrophagus putrescentiae]